MNIKYGIGAAVGCLMMAGAAFGKDPARQPPLDTKPTSAVNPATDAKAATEPAAAKPAEPKGAAAPSGSADQERLEREFTALLTGATLRGVWQMTGEGGLSGKGSLTEPKPEAYHIVSAAKLADNFWLISARIEVGDKDVTVPVPVRVQWAGETPVITLDDVPVPGIGTYSARVMFFGGFYSGTWLSREKNYGGIMAGQVLTPAAAEPSDK